MINALDAPSVTSAVVTSAILWAMWSLLVKSHTDDFFEDTVNVLSDMLIAQTQGRLLLAPRLLEVMQRWHFAGFAPFPNHRTLKDTKTLRMLCDVLDIGKEFILSTYIGFPNGDMVGCEVCPQIVTGYCTLDCSKETKHILKGYIAFRNGTRGDPTPYRVPTPYTPVVRPWFKAALEGKDGSKLSSAQKQASHSQLNLPLTSGKFSKPFVFSPAVGNASQYIGYTAVMPIYSLDGELFGVMGADILNQDLNSILKEATHNISPNSRGWVTDVSGFMVATSHGLVTVSSTSGERIAASSSTDLIIRAGATFLDRQNLAESRAKHISFKGQTGDHLVTMTLLSHELQMLLILMVDQADVQAELNRFTQINARTPVTPSNNHRYTQITFSILVLGFSLLAHFLKHAMPAKADQHEGIDASIEPRIPIPGTHTRTALSHTRTVSQYHAH